jgi:hypothetical protein
MTMYTISFAGNFTYLMIMIGLIVATRYRLALAGVLAKPKDVFIRATLPSAPASRPIVHG